MPTSPVYDSIYARLQQSLPDESVTRLGLRPHPAGIRIKLRIATHCKAVHTLLMYSTQCENL
jgi:hypothetical protein